MSLRLRVVSDHRRALGERSNAVFGVGGGTIGRSVDNDWVLPDPLRYVSAHHARIRFQDGHYYLEDVSTNGAYVNDEDQPLNKRGPHRLINGDLIRLGEYQIVVALDAETGDTPKTERSDVAGGVPTSIHALQGVGRVAQTDIGAALDLDELLETDVGIDSDFAPQPAVNTGAQPVAGAAQSLLSDEPTDSAINRRIARLAKSVSRAAQNGVSVPALYDVQSGIAAFCRGAGVDPEHLPADAQTRLMHLVGQLLRETLVGLKDLDRARTEIRNRFRIEIPVAADDPRPAFARLTVEELIVQLMNKHETRSVDAVQWLREALNGAKEHESATAHAFRTAFVEFLDRLDPAELEARFERAARRGKAKASDRAQYWDLYGEFYRNLIEMPQDHLPHTFVEAFAREYRELLKK